MSCKEWKKVRLGDVCEISSSKRIFAKEYCERGIPFYRGKEIIEKQKGNNISTELFISEDRFLEIKNKHGIPQKGDILLTSVGTLGIPWVVDQNNFYFKDGNLTWFRSYKGIDSKYLYYWFISPDGVNQINQKAIGSTQKALTIDSLKSFEVDLPPLKEQQRIAVILGALDDKIELNNKINKNLEEQASALFKHWFVDFEFPDANGKPYKSSGGAFKDSELGPIPSNWSIGKFTDIIDILGGGTPNTNTPNFWNGDIPFFTPKDVKEDGFVLSTEKNITKAGLQKCNSKLYSLGTVFITARGTVGKVAIAGSEMAMNQSCYALVGKNKVQQYFVYYKTKEIVSLLKNKANGAVFDAITTRDFESEFIIIPQLELLVLFEESVKVLMSLMYNNLIENEALVQTRDTLLPKLMNNDMKLV